MNLSIESVMQQNARRAWRQDSGQGGALRNRLVACPAHFGKFGAVILAIASIASAATPVHADQSRWWEGITGFGPPDFSGQKRRADQPTPSSQVALKDLRRNAVPWRSDEMLMSVNRAIARYQRIVQRGGWPKMPGNRMIRPGEDDERVPILKRILRATGDYRKGSSYFESLTFDSTLEQGVKRFQMRHGLRPTGRVDRPTLAALSVSAEERLKQLRQNYDRISELLRMAPADDRYVLVNAAAYQLEAVDRHQVERRHRVIVGRPGRDTPQLRAMIKAVNFFPNWKVPESVARLDLIPRLIKEPQYLYDENIRVLEDNFNGPEIDPTHINWQTADAKKIRFRQEPGPKNALGLVRIDMQNPEGVYMHDTPMKELFAQPSRAFSAGCVRVQDVFDLVAWLLRYEEGWGQSGQIDQVLAAGQPLDINLTRQVPVYFAYITAWAEPDGLVQFRSDIYDRDGQGAVANVWDPEEPPPPKSIGALAP